MAGDMEDVDACSNPLGRGSILYYGVGHMLNDITAACWFTYLLVFLTDIGLSSRDAAAVMFTGQMADGLTTVFVGELIDRFGHFKKWHAAGSLIAAASFFSVFGGCIPCKIFRSNSLLLQTVGYSIFAAIFNMGWAATQVSHMSMVNCITLNSTSRVALASCRNAFTMIANLGLYGIALIVFNTVSSSGSQKDVENQYRWVAYPSVLIGGCFVGLFHLRTEEPRLKLEAHSRKGYARILWAYWFKKLLFYQVAVVYVLTRLATNVSQAFLAFYVINEVHMSRPSIALVPAVIYIISFVVSLFLQELTWTCQRLKYFYAAGGLLWLCCGVGIFFLPSSLRYFLYIMAVLIGLANALMMVTGVSMQSLLVGDDIHGCAFVYGSLSFLDKIFCGVALAYWGSRQNSTRILQDCNPENLCFSSTRYALGLFPAFCAFVGVLVTYSMDLDEPLSLVSLSSEIEDPLLE